MTPTEALTALVAAVPDALVVAHINMNHRGLAIHCQDSWCMNKWSALAQAQAVLASGAAPQATTDELPCPHCRKPTSRPGGYCSRRCEHDGPTPDRTTWPTRSDYINAVWGVEGLSRQQAERIADILHALPHPTPEALAERIVGALFPVDFSGRERAMATILRAIQETPR